MTTTTNTNYLIVAHMQVPTDTRFKTEPKSMFIPKGMDVTEFIEFICEDPYTFDELEELAMPDAAETRRDYGLSYDRIMFTLTVGRIIKQMSPELPYIPAVLEYMLKEIGVTIERVPMLINERTHFTFSDDGVMTTERYERFISGWYNECIACLTQDYSAVASYLPSGNYGLLEMMNLFLWERGMWEMGQKFELPKFSIELTGVGE